MLGLALLALNAQRIELKKLEGLLASDPKAAAGIVRRMVEPEDLSKGANPVEQGVYALFAVEGTSDTKEATIVGAGDHAIKLFRLEGNLFAAVRHFKDGDGYLVEYHLDGHPVRRGVQLEVYEPNPYTMSHPEGMQGELREMGEWKSEIYPGTTRKWYLYLPPKLDQSLEYALLVAQDAQWDRQWIANALDNCGREGKIPPVVGVFIEPGQSTPGTYSNRSKEYDPLSSTYARFLTDEMFPQVEKVVRLSKDPAKRAIVGMSSGGICSFTACWERPDQFGVAISFIGSFTNIASGESKREGGHNYPFLIRKSEKKPIRVFLQDGSNDLNNDHGNWWLANQQMASALSYKNYEHWWISGMGFHNTKHARRIFDRVLVWWFGSPG